MTKLQQNNFFEIEAVINMLYQRFEEGLDPEAILLDIDIVCAGSGINEEDANICRHLVDTVCFAKEHGISREMMLELMWAKALEQWNRK
jgi:hypothetical protein